MRRVFAVVGCVVLFVVSVSPAHAHDGPAEVEIGEPETVDIAPTSSEGLDVAGNRLVYVSAPGEACGGAGENAGFSVLLNVPGTRLDLREVVTGDLGLGVVAAVAVHPSATYALFTQWDPMKPSVNPGRVVAVVGDRVVGSVAVGPTPDSVGISANGKFAVIACEASTPDPADCAAETPEEDVAGSIQVLDLRRGPSRLSVAAVITAQELFDRFFATHPARAASPNLIEPEFVATAPHAPFALVTLQEQSAVAVVDLRVVRDLSDRGGLTPDEIGAAALVDVVFLPHGFVDRRGKLRGTQPDGISISHDERFAVTANEANTDARHLHGISVLDLRAGWDSISVAGTYCIFDLDPSLLNGTGLSACPAAAPGDPFPADAANLPRLDPEDTAIIERDDDIVIAVAIERAAKDQDRGSVLFLDASAVLDGTAPVKIDRKLVGINAGTRPESLDAARDGRFVFSANELDGGSITRIPIVR